MCFSPCSNKFYQEFSIPSTQLKCWLNQPCAEYLRDQDDYGNFYPKALYYMCKKHFIKMLKDVGMVVPKIKETRL